MKKLLSVIILFAMLWAVFSTFHEPVLRSIGRCLIHEDSLQKSDAIVVISGSAFERGNKGAELLNAGFAKSIICPGGNLDLNYLILFGDSVYESDITKKKIVQNGVPDTLVYCTHEGTSTIEEAQTILRYCVQQHVSSIIVVSSFFHTARVNRVYRKVFANSSIRVAVRGAHSVRFDEDNWWKSEDGLIGFNNEMMKSLYYFLKH